MSPIIGTLAALTALVGWGTGDFAIQRSVRRLGSLQTLFFVAVAGTIIFLPFVWHHLPALFGNRQSMVLLLGAAATMGTAAFLNFEALRSGKISVLEPVISIELPMTIAIGVLLLGEAISLQQFLLALTVFLGLELTVIHRAKHRYLFFFFHHHFRLEDGVVLAVLGAIFLGFTNILSGLGGQASDPLTAIWMIHTVIAVLLFCLFLWQGILGEVFKQCIQHWRPVVSAGILDNLAWAGFITAATILPISVTTAISEGFVALAATLGIIFNGERPQHHQKIGIGIALVAAIALAIISG